MSERYAFVLRSGKREILKEKLTLTLARPVLGENTRGF